MTCKLKDITVLPAEVVQPLVDENLGGNRFTAHGNISKAWTWEVKICLKLRRVLDIRFQSASWGSVVQRLLHSQCMWQKVQCEVLCWTTQCTMLPLADVCWCPEICAGALVWYELNNSCMNVSWPPTSQALTSPARDPDLFVMGPNKSPTTQNTMAPCLWQETALHRRLLALHRRETQMVGRILLCWCVWGSEGLWGRTHLSTDAGVLNLCSVCLNTAPKQHRCIYLFASSRQFVQTRRDRDNGGQTFRVEI